MISPEELASGAAVGLGLQRAFQLGTFLQQDALQGRWRAFMAFEPIGCGSQCLVLLNCPIQILVAWEQSFDHAGGEFHAHGLEDRKHRGPVTLFEWCQQRS